MFNGDIRSVILQHSLSFLQFQSELLLSLAGELVLEVLNVLLSPDLHSLQSLGSSDIPSVVFLDMVFASLQSQDDEISLVGFHGIVLRSIESSHSNSSGHHASGNLLHNLLDL